VSDHIEGLRVTNKELKEQLYQDLLDGSFLSHVMVQLKPSIEDLKSDITLNIEEIEAQKVIRSDGLTKDRLLDAIYQVIDMYGYMMSLLGKYHLYHRRFDPSSHV
jgi:hypothetical protein